MGVPAVIIHFNGVFHHEPAFFGYPHFMEKKKHVSPKLPKTASPSKGPRHRFSLLPAGHDQLIRRRGRQCAHTTWDAKSEVCVAAAGDHHGAVAL